MSKVSQKEIDEAFADEELIDDVKPSDDEIEAYDAWMNGKLEGQNYDPDDNEYDAVDRVLADEHSHLVDLDYDDIDHGRR